MLSRIDDELEAVAVAISEEFGILAEGYRPGEKLRSSPLNEAFATFEEKVSEIREQGAFSSTSLQTNLAFYGGFAALRSLRDELNNLRSLAQICPAWAKPLPVAKQLALSTDDRLGLGEDRDKGWLSRRDFNSSPEVDQSASEWG